MSYFHRCLNLNGHQQLWLLYLHVWPVEAAVAEQFHPLAHLWVDVSRSDHQPWARLRSWKKLQVFWLEDVDVSLTSTCLATVSWIIDGHLPLKDNNSQTSGPIWGEFVQKHTHTHMHPHTHTHIMQHSFAIHNSWTSGVLQNIPPVKGSLNKISLALIILQAYKRKPWGGHPDALQHTQVQTLVLVSVQGSQIVLILHISAKVVNTVNNTRTNAWTHPCTCISVRTFKGISLYILDEFKPQPSKKS